MTEQKDITNLIPNSPTLAEQEMLPPVSDHPLVDQFESLEDYSENQSPPEQPAELPPPTVLDNIKQYSETGVTPSKVPAAFPFSLMIQGPLAAHEKQKLLDLISQEQLGFREVDLEVQFANNKILLPRISEYAGIMVIQALRGTQAEMRFGPSDTIFSTEDTRSDPKETADPVEEKSTSFTADLSHPAEAIPVTAEDKISETTHFEVLDTLTASAVLKSKMVEAENSTEYQEIIEALQRELKYKAYRKGAIGIIHFKIQLNILSSPSHYRVLAMGTAIKAVEK